MSSFVVQREIRFCRIILLFVLLITNAFSELSSVDVVMMEKDDLTLDLRLYIIRIKPPADVLKIHFEIAFDVVKLIGCENIFLGAKVGSEMSVRAEIVLWNV